MPGPCPRCHRQVYAAEERLALSGRSWHQECFTCAVCNKSLDSTNITENQENQEIYCRNCYRILYGTKGYGYGPNEPTLIANCGPEDCYDLTPTPSRTDLHHFQGTNKAVIVKPFEQQPFRKGYLYWGKRPTPKHYAHQAHPIVEIPRAFKKCEAYHQPSIQQVNNPRDAASSIYDRCAPCCAPCNPDASRSDPNQCIQRAQSTNIKSTKSSSSHSYNRIHSGGTELCRRCGKPVYFAERKYGYRGVYHTRCYVCGSCGKSLESTTVNENNGVLYCSGCYKRFVATAGVGYGIGAGTLQTK